MDEYESTDGTPPPASVLTVVYDPRDGRIVYVHEVIAGAGGAADLGTEDERERAALEGVRRHHVGADTLRVLHLAPGFRFDRGELYRVDTHTGAVTLRKEALPAAGAHRSRVRSG
jgi:hypothetical protein